jgi:prevent-host-death family protein
MPAWPLQDAKARFSELVDTALKKGPQVVTRRGVETVVIVPVEEWRRLTSSARPDIIKLLVDDGPKFDIPLPDRKQWRWRPRVKFE